MIKGFTFDTSALVSLGHTDLVKIIIDNFEVIISKTIVKELKEIAQYQDDDARAAKRWLKNLNLLQVLDDKEKKNGESDGENGTPGNNG